MKVKIIFSLLLIFNFPILCIASSSKIQCSLSCQTDSPSNKEKNHQKFREQVSRFYKISSELNLGSILQYKSVITGDSHIENFGVLSKTEGESDFGPNDFDEIELGSLYLDFLRLYSSVSIIDTNIDLKMIKEAYLDGLQNKKRDFSLNTKNKIKKSGIEKNLLDPKFVDIKKKKFIKFKSGKTDLNEEESLELTQVLKSYFPKIEIHDRYLRIKTSGGSANKLRYQVLASLTPESNPVWIDMKEQSISSYSTAFPSVFKTPEERISFSIKEVLIPLLGEESVLLVSWKNRFFLVRYIQLGNIATRYKDFKKGESLYFDEFYSLGLFHHRFSQKDTKIESYTKDFTKLSIDTILEQKDSLLEKLFN